MPSEPFASALPQTLVNATSHSFTSASTSRARNPRTPQSVLRIGGVPDASQQGALATRAHKRLPTVPVLSSVPCQLEIANAALKLPGTRLFSKVRFFATKADRPITPFDGLATHTLHAIEYGIGSEQTPAGRTCCLTEPARGREGYGRFPARPVS